MANIDTSTDKQIRDNEETFFLQQIKKLGIKEIHPRFTNEGVVYDSCNPLLTYYEPTQIIMLLDKLSEKKYFKKNNYGVIALCPNCQSPLHMRVLTCIKCNSSRIIVKYKISHSECGYTGYFQEYLDGLHMRCPRCNEKLTTTNFKKLPESFIIDGPFFFCQDCGNHSNNHRNQFNCIQCKTKFSDEETDYKNLNGYIFESQNLEEKEILEELDEPKPLGSSEQISDVLKNNNEVSLETEQNKESLENVKDFEEKNNFIEKLFKNQKVNDKRVKKEASQLKSKRILLIENNDATASNIIDEINKSNLSIELTHATNGKSALKELRNAFDLIILNMNLVDLKGIFILREISKWNIKIPLILLNIFESELEHLTNLNLAEYQIVNPEKDGFNKILKILNKTLKI
jgi:CheY-like chemotaxis protein